MTGSRKRRPVRVARSNRSGAIPSVAIGAATHVRHFRFAIQAAPLALAALVGLGALELAALRQLYGDSSLRPAVVGLALLTADSQKARKRVPEVAMERDRPPTTLAL